MKVFLDDQRSAPDGWVRCSRPDEVIELLHSGEVKELSLDHDLGDDGCGTGYDVLLWIEEAVGARGWSPPKLSVHSVNPPAREKMMAAILQIQRLVARQTDYSKHRDDGTFLISWDGSKPVWFIGHNDEPTMLEGSANISVLFDLGDGSVLGASQGWRCYRTEFLEKGWRRPLTPQPMAVWSAASGRRTGYLHGHHFGDVCGADILEDGRLVTWGRDYLLRVWDSRSGVCTKVLPLPLWPDAAKGLATLSSERFGVLKRSQKQRYVDTQHLPAPDVRIDWIVNPGGKQHSEEFTLPGHAEQKIVRRWVPNLSEHGADRILDITGAEAGYSTWFLAADGRLLGGGTTYGSSGQFYVWDGFHNLRILIVGRHDCNLDLCGEVEPGTIEMHNTSGVDSCDVYRFHI